ncbi:ATP-binding cassette domain-containing protein, partial [Enterobacter hormaechei]|nr:ATP-binding cassette domain-containing protein [Enterobacter hormaechei]
QRQGEGMASGGVGGNAQPGPLIALFVFCALAAFEALAPVTGAFQHLGQVIASALRITDIAEQEPEVKFSAGQTAVPEQVALTLSNVTFAYDKQAQNALEDITLSVDAGQRIAILGRTGCGKSTLLQLLTRAWDPQQGEILFNDVPLSGFSEAALRKTVSVVPQRVHLFSATLRDNLLLAAPDASDDTLRAMLEQVGLHKLLEDDGLNSWLGEGGRQLSGGELRRLAIARALLHDAPLMLLDEPTEGLDTESERAIQSALDELQKNRTSLVIAHRLSTIEQADEIVVVEDGIIVERGSHADLLEHRGVYAQLRAGDV